MLLSASYIRHTIRRDLSEAPSPSPMHPVLAGGGLFTRSGRCPEAKESDSNPRDLPPITDLSLVRPEPVQKRLSLGQRRLAAIMFTDMVGYTALGQRNESLSLALVDEHRKLIRPILVRHNGREVKTMGDAFLVEFPNALDAVRCAYDIQRSVREFNLSLAPDNRIHLRIGVHVGEVVESDGDISGDAVNVASRIEPVAEDGGVCISRQVHDHVSNKVDFPFLSLGLKSLKNVTNKVEVYRMAMPWEGGRTGRETEPDKRRIAVLPFANISPDPADEYFADGLTEELISKLSLVKGLKVIARTSVMSYKNKEKKISDIGSELGVGTIVEGSVRKAGNKIRVTAQLIDVGNEEHLWASSYDRNVDDIFAVQAELASGIAESLPGVLSSPAVPVVGRGDTSNVEAFSYHLKARHLMNQGTVDSLRQALELLTGATKLDPKFARAYVEIGNCYAWLGIKNAISRDEGIHGMKSGAEAALRIDGELAEGHALLAFIAWAEDDHINDEKEAERAIELNPNLADAYLRLATVKATNGYPREWVRLLQIAHTLDPLSSEVIGDLGMAYFYNGREAEALDYWRANRKFAPFVVARNMAEFFLAKKDFGAAEGEIKELHEMAPSETTTIVCEGMLSALRGNLQEAQMAISTLERRFKGGAVTERNIGYIRYCLGDMDAYFAAMLRAVDDHVFDPDRYRYSPLFERARNDPRYPEVLRRNGLDPEIKE